MVTLGERYIDVHCTLLATFLWVLFFKIKHSREEEKKKKERSLCQGSTPWPALAGRGGVTQAGVGN
jgi:hypothetical protein